MNLTEPYWGGLGKFCVAKLPRTVYTPPPQLPVINYDWSSKSTHAFGVEKLFPSRTVGVSVPGKGGLLHNYTQFFSQKTPVEFFGVPLDDNSILHDAPFPEILAECRGVLEEMNKGSIWRSHVDRNANGQNRCSFYKALANLLPDDQQKCFEKIVECLQRSEGTKHIADHLLKGRFSFVRYPPLPRFS